MPWPSLPASEWRRLGRRWRRKHGFTAPKPPLDWRGSAKPKSASLSDWLRFGPINVLGNFRDMLGAVTKHPAMLSYLDNAQSVGPNSSVGLRRRVGLNENHARELLELHTIGVDGGYDQADVTALARIMTGWTFARNSNQRVPIGSFLFAGAGHEPGVQTVLGVHYPAGGVQQGEAVLDMLTVHPETGRHIAFKLVRHFVADDPPEDLVAELATTFVDSGGDLKAVALALIGSDTAFAEATKIKTPQEFLWSSLRALELDIGPQLVLRGLRTLGQPMWDPPSPEGFSDESATWLAPDAMTDRLDIAEILVERANIGYLPGELVDLILGPAVSSESRQAVLSAASRTQAVALLLMTPEFQRR